MRIGVFGGTFDPVHYGHLLLAECCREQARLDQVWFMPAATPPHKRPEDLSPADDRLAMLNLAIGGHEAFLTSRREIDRGGVSYTVETLESMHAEQPQVEWFLLMGADSLEDLPNWREPQRICELALPVVARRPGSPEPDYTRLALLMSADRLAAAREHLVDTPQLDLSSSDLRRRVAAGLSIRYRTPRAVEKYIEAAELYTHGHHA